MPLDLSHKALHIRPQPDPFHLLQYSSETQVPASIFTNPAYSFTSIIKTPDEISVVVSCRTPGDGKLTSIDGLGEAQESDGPWLALRVRGPMELSMYFANLPEPLLTEHVAMTGVLNALTKPFVESEIPIFALSSWYVQCPCRS
jgi:hypothetical protein